MKKKPTLPPEVAAFFEREGKRGGKLAAANMTPAQRKRRSQKAVRARRAQAAKARAAKKGENR